VPDALLLTLALGASCAGQACLALSLESHWRQAGAPGRRPPAVRMRATGAGLLVVALMLCLAVNHPSIAALVWIMMNAVAATSVAATLAWRPAWLRAPGRLLADRRRAEGV